MTTVFPTIKAINTFIIDGVGSGGDYHNVCCFPFSSEVYCLHVNILIQVKGGHWLIDSPIATPMARWEQYRSSRTSWGINVLGSFCVEIEATDGTKGFATGFGGPPACWLVAQHFERFLIGAGMDRLISSVFSLKYCCSASDKFSLKTQETPTIHSKRCTGPPCFMDAKASQLQSYQS